MTTAPVGRQIRGRTLASFHVFVILVFSFGWTQEENNRLVLSDLTAKNQNSFPKSFSLSAIHLS